MIAFFREIYSEVLFLLEKRALVLSERVPPGHPIILLKSNKFNMAAVSVKRSINLSIGPSPRENGEKFRNAKSPSLGKPLLYILKTRQIIIRGA